MGLRIEKITVKNLGPLQNFSEDFKTINLIYGQNEKGKTYLVEFIIKRIFRNPVHFVFRKDDASGKVWISGLEPGLSEFSVSSSKKIEDYWDESGIGLPENMARLLVVKGAELDFEVNKHAGISKAAIKAFLSNEKLLDKVQERIQKTVRSSVFENGQIFGENRGSIKDRNNLMERLNNLDALLKKVDREYSGGPVYILEQEIKKIKTEYDLLVQAKRYTAWILKKKIDGLKENLAQLDEAGLGSLLTGFDLINYLNSEHFSKKKRLNELRQESSEYEWLENAIQTYQHLADQGAVQIKNIYLYLGLSGLSVGLVLNGIGASLSVFIEPQAGLILYLFGMLFLFGGVIFGFLYIRQYLGTKKTFSENLEAARIRESFENKMGKKFSDLATLKTELNTRRTAYFNAKSLEEDLENLQKRIRDKENEARQIYSRLGITPGEVSSWGQKISKLAGMQKNLQKRIADLELELAGLDVSPDDFLSENPGKSYDRQEIQRHKNRLEEVEEQIQNEKQNLSLLQREIQAVIGDHETQEWEVLLEKLRKLRLETLREYCQLSASILAGILVNKVVKEARAQEDEKIQSYLETDIMKEPLLNLTGRYDRLHLEGDEVILSDAYDSFDLADLSTGAREQVLLALRLGLAAKVMGRDSGFLILDDAFQHSDWKRRENLVKGVYLLAEKGWQILYFSMDDHIMQLFDKYSPGMDYKKIILASENI